MDKVRIFFMIALVINLIVTIFVLISSMGFHEKEIQHYKICRVDIPGIKFYDSEIYAIDGNGECGEIENNTLYTNQSYMIRVT